MKSVFGSRLRIALTVRHPIARYTSASSRLEDKIVLTIISVISKSSLRPSNFRDIHRINPAKSPAQNYNAFRLLMTIPEARYTRRTVTPVIENDRSAPFVNVFGAILPGF